MVYKWVSVDNLIARIESTFQIKSPEYIQLLPLWVTDALKALRVNLPLEPYHTPLKVVDYVATLPANLSVLSIITKDDRAVLRANTTLLPIVNINAYNDTITTQVPLSETTENEDGTISVRTIPTEVLHTDTSSDSYVLHHNKILEFTFESGTVELYYLRIPYTIDEATGIKVPNIPDTQPAMENIMWYILRNYLYRGYKHPILNLNSNNHHVNPASRYEETITAARNSLMRWDNEKHESIFRVLTNFVQDADYVSRNFNTK